MAFLSEAAVELALLEQLRGLGYSVEREEDIGPDGQRPERESHDEVVLKKRFEDAVARLNPGLPLEARQDAIRKVTQSELPSLLEENRRIHRLLAEGVDAIAVCLINAYANGEHEARLRELIRARNATIPVTLSSELLPEGAQGWDWIGLNLDDGSGLMAFRLRDAAGKALWSAATIRPAGQIGQVLPPEAVHFTPLRQWHSPRSGIDWPVVWGVQVGGRHFELQPLIDDQELDSRRSTGAIYWEGAVRALEDGREVGRGYLEMTGYGKRIRVG